MYRTDKQFMKDPNTASARIYVGHLAETVVPDNLEEKFRNYGKVLGMLLQKGFAFIQFENERQAQAAINAENGSMFHRRKLIVRQVYEGKPRGGPNQQQQHQHQQQQQQNQQGPMQQQMHMPPPPQNLHQNKAIPDLFQNQIAPPIEHPMAEMPPPQQQQQGMQLPPCEQDVVPVAPTPPNVQMENMEIGGTNATANKRGNKRKHWNNRHDRKQMNAYRDGAPPPRFDEPNKFGAPMGGFGPPPVMDVPEKNDCEIIVVSKALTEYAEYIEQRLKSLGLIVDLLFPNEDVPLGRVLANISSRGCLYAMLIMPQNEENRSLTLNILHGIPEEHRNMPVEDAMILITRNFDAYMRGEKFEIDGPLATLTEKHPEAVQMIFNLLAENRQITATQYDRVIKYLQERRELQRNFEGVESSQSNDGEPNSKEAELQNRIMNILNKPSMEVSKPAASSSTTAPTPLLNDPSVQKALDSLLSGDMFKSISAGI